MENNPITNDVNKTQGTNAEVLPIGSEQVKKFTAILQEYKSGRTKTEARIKASENWWKLRNSMEEEKDSKMMKEGNFKSVSGWLHNVIVSKHADAMEAYPEPNILPREPGDRKEAQKLSSIIPCILEHNQFEQTYSDVCWQKLKTGTGAYKVVWDTSKLGGLGDIGIEKANLLNLYWEPGVTDIQKSRYFFHTELYDKDILIQNYPELDTKLKGQSFLSTSFLYDDQVKTADKATVIDVYYHKVINGKNTLQYCKYVDDFVLYASENVPEMAVRGFYDHGKYPYVFDPLFPIEGSPCGYGFVDICRNPQTEIDILKTSFVKNAVAGSTPRYFARQDGAVNIDTFLDLTKNIVPVAGNVNEDYLRLIEHNPLDGNYVAVLDRTIEELRETSGNTETSTGNAGSGVTAASAIAALQEASGKGSRDSTKAAYRAFSLIVELCIELIRQFYTAPRQFRILGEYGTEQFTSYSNNKLQPIHQGNAFGADQGFRLPVFDIKVSAQKKNVYTTVANNELALQFFKMGFFNPQMSDQALLCLDLMDFDGKEITMQKIARNGTMFEKLTQYMQLALVFAQAVRPDMVQGISHDIMQTMGGLTGSGVPSGVSANMIQSDNIAGLGRNESTRTQNARAQAAGASQPSTGAITKREK